MSPARASHGAALVAACVRAACVAKAPRRTVAAVAAAAVSAALQLDDAAVAPPMPVPEQTARPSGPDGGQEDTVLVQQLRQRRAERRRAKRSRRKAAKAAAASPREDASLLEVVSDVVLGGDTDNSPSATAKSPEPKRPRTCDDGSGKLEWFDVLLKSGIQHVSDGSSSTITRATLGEPEDFWSNWTLIPSSVPNPKERMFIPSERCLSTGPASLLAPLTCFLVAKPVTERDSNS